MKRAARRRLAEAKARASLADVEIEPISDPIAAFADLVSETVALKSQLAAEVASTQGDRSTALSAYERALDRCGKLLSRWVELGLVERFELRRVELRQAQTSLISIALSRVLARLDVSEEQQTQALLDLGDVMQELADSTGEWLGNPWLHVESPGLDAAVSAYEQEDRRRKLERAADVLVPSHESELTRVFEKIDTMAERLVRPEAPTVEPPPVIVEETSVHTEPANVIIDPKSGAEHPVVELDPPPPPREPEVVPPKRPRVQVADIRLPELDPWHRSLPAIAGRRPAAPEPEPEREPDAKDETE